jgi:type IV pilus assembly protein PilM
MAASPHILSVNLGSRSVSLAAFRRQADGCLVLHGFRMREMPADPASESVRNAQITMAFREMLAELQITNGKVNYAVASQSVFARFVKLPSIDEEKIERIISFEAQQNVPFPIDEVVWDYQLVGGGTEEQIQVVLVAIKADLLEGINGAIENAGLEPVLVDVATMALYNAFRYNYQDLIGCSLLVDIGARTTNLLFIEPGKVFSRSIPIGGTAISVAIAKEMGEPLAAAEFRKKRAGFVSLSGADAEPADPDVARISKIVRSTMTRLHAELMRSISHYRAQQQGNAPQRIFLAGGSANTPDIREFFQEKLQLPIEFFNPLRNVTVASADIAEHASKSAHLLGELVGLALRGVTTCPMELNLAPASVVRAQEMAKRRPFLILAAACLVLGLLEWSAYYFRAATVERRATERLQEKVDAMQAVERQMDTLKREIKGTDSVATPLITAINDRNFWPALLEELNARLPKQDIWITELIPSSGGKPVGMSEAERAKLTATALPAPPPYPPGRTPNESMIDGVLVRGLYLFNPKQQEVVVDFFRNLVTSKFFKIDQKNQSRVIRKDATPSSTEWAFPYELQLELATPMKLP